MSKRERYLRRRIRRELEVYRKVYEGAEQCGPAQELIELMLDPNSRATTKANMMDAVDDYMGFQKRIIDLRDVYERLSVLTDQYREIPQERQNAQFLEGLEEQLAEMERFRDHSTDNLLSMFSTTLTHLLLLLNESKKAEG